MKRYFFPTFFSLLLVVSIAYSQQKQAAISFDKEVHNFGEINEADGPATCSFEFTNTGSEPLIVNNVKASCGCTTPEWTKTPVAPGKTGFVKATYNPQNRPGKFNKTITILSNAENPTAILRIEGSVIQKPLTIADNYPQQMGSLRLKSNHIAIMKIKNTEIKTGSLDVINDGSENIKIAFENIPLHILIKAEPEVLKPGETGKITATYDATKKNDWGFIIDRVDVKINDSNDPRNRLSVSATIEEDFSKLTPEQLANAPVIEFESKVFEFGNIKEGESVSYDYKFTNKGKSDLLIRKIKASCGCTVTNPSDEIIKPGKTSTIKTTFNSRGKKDKQNKTITIITNDPVNHTTLLQVNGNVEPAPVE